LHCLKIFGDINTRPYLNWAFNDSSDCINASCAFKEIRIREPAQRIFRSLIQETQVFACSSFHNDSVVYPSQLHEFLGADLNALSYCESKNHAISIWGVTAEMNVGRSVISRKYLSRLKSALVEFRFFDNPVDYNEQELHVKFVQAYVAYVRELSMSDVSRRLDKFKHRSYASSVKKSQEEFNLFLEEIGLDARLYKKFAGRIQQRAAFGFSCMD